jgi:peptidoglycan/LPS O-acetylase OafA/YrhL
MLVLGVARGTLSAPLSHPALVALGEASYSLYILQLPVGIWMLETVLGERAPANFMKMSRAAFLPYVAALVVVSLLTFRFVERPAQGALRRLFRGFRLQGAVGG